MSIVTIYFSLSLDSLNSVLHETLSFSQKRVVFSIFSYIFFINNINLYSSTLFYFGLVDFVSSYIFICHLYFLDFWYYLNVICLFDLHLSLKC